MANHGDQLQSVLPSRRRETRGRAVLKSLTYRATGLALTVGVAYAVTGRSDVAASIGMVDTLVKLVAFYGHERVWTFIDFGRAAAVPSAQSQVSPAGAAAPAERGRGDE